MAVTDELAGRYGRSRSRIRRERWWIVGVAIAFVAVFAAWTVWAGYDGTSATLEETDTAYTVHNAQSVSVSFTINTAPGQPVSCAVEAMNATFAIVGWKIVSYPASQLQVTSHTETVRTTELATTGLISQCWLT
jgi:cytochrome c oxidase assembly protein Cox11